MRHVLTECRATYSLGDFEAVLEAISSGELMFSELSPHTNDISGRMKPEGMITKTIQLDKVVEEGFTTLIEDKENHVKILVDVGNSVAS